MLTLYLMRHGQTTHSDCLRGSLDDELTELGFAQMHSAWDNFAHKDDIQAIISSDLKRCANFAKELSEKLDLPLLLIPQLQELHFGDWEGQKVADIYEQYPDELANFWQTPTKFTPPNGEPFLAFTQRIDESLLDIESFACLYCIKHILIITHGGVIKYLTCKAKNLPLDDILKNKAELGHIYAFDYHDGQLTIL